MARFGRRIRARLKFPIALKFALFIAVLAVTVTAWQARVATKRAAEHLDREINRHGALLVSSVARLVRPAWLDDPRHRDELMDLIQRVAGESDSSQRIENIIVFDAAGGARALLATARVTAGQVVDDPAAAALGVKISELEANGVPVRTFSKWLPPLPGGAHPAGRVDLQMSARDIRDVAMALSAELTRVTLIASAASAVASFFLAAFLTRSIRTLVKDMRAVSLGDVSHQSSIDTSDELGDLARSFNHMTANLSVAQEAKIAQRALEHELSLATSIQKQLLPRRQPKIPGIDIAAHCASAKEVGGDYFDFIPIDRTHLGLVVADVSGKGVPGSLVMTMTRSLIRMAAAGHPDPALTLREVNRTLSPDLRPGMFVTALYCVLDARTKELQIARAGHNAPLLLSRSKPTPVHIEPRGIALGLDSGGELFQRELEISRIRLRPGDLLVAYTDGVVEAADPDGQVFGDEALARLVTEKRDASAQEVVDAILREVDRHRRSADPSDDVTVVVLRA